MRLAIFTHVLHQTHAGGYSAYVPYIREMNLWLQQVNEVEVVAPLRLSIGAKGEKNLKGLPYQHSNLTFTAVPSFDILNLPSILLAVIKIPVIFFRIAGAMRRANHLHLRCPGNIGLLAAICQIFFPNKPKTAKYAGNWNPEAKQPWTYKLQKWILSNTFLTRNMKVLVYGNWPEQSKNILPFFTASFNESEKEVVIKDFNSPYKFLFVGSLVKGKQPLFAMQLVEALNKKNIPAELDIYGDGLLKNDLEKEAENKDYIHLHGNQPLEVLKRAFKEAHFLILASKSEGWPKAVAEGMFFGCIPIATAVSCVPWMLEGGSRGILMSEGNLGDENHDNQVDSGHPPQRFGQGGRRSEDNQDGLGKVDVGLLDTFQKNRQFECFPVSPEGERGNVSRTGFSETPAYRQDKLEVTSGKNNEWKDALEATVQKIIELINDPEEMKRMSIEAQEWSQEYTLERFEEEIKKLLVPQDARP